MKKIIVVFIAFLFSLGLNGCVSMPLKRYSETLPRTNSIYLEKAKLCKLREVGLQISFEEPIDGPSAGQLEVVEIYGVSLKKELEKRGFAVVDDSSKEGTVIIKTKIGEVPGRLFSSGLGIVGVEIKVWNSNDKLLLSFQKAVNSHFWGSPAKKQIRKFIAPQVAEQLKKELF